MFSLTSITFSILTHYRLRAVGEIGGAPGSVQSRYLAWHVPVR